MKAITRSMIIFLHFLFTPANADSQPDTEWYDMAYACTYILNKGVVLLDGMPEPCKPMISQPAKMTEEPVLRALQIYIEATRSGYAEKNYLAEFTQLPSTTWPDLAKNTYFMFGLNSAMQEALLEAFRTRNGTGTTRAGHSEFIDMFYRSVLEDGNFDSLGNTHVAMGVFASWFILHENHDLAISSLERLKSVSENHTIEHATYMSIFSIANIRRSKNGLGFLKKMKAHFGEIDWRTVYAVSSAISDVDSAQRFLHNIKESTPRPNFDMWGLMQAWIKSDILSTAPDAGESILMGQANRYFHSKEYDKAMEIVEYILKNHKDKICQKTSMHENNARSLGAEIILSQKKYDQLRPYLKKYGGAPQASKPGSL